MKTLLVLPIIIPLLAAALCLLCWARPKVQRVLSVVSCLTTTIAAGVLLYHVASHGIQVTQIGDWPAPFGITLVADIFSALMLIVATSIALAVTIYSLATIDVGREAFGYHPLLLILQTGICGAFLTGDLFNLYVWFEVMLVASFVLLVLGGEPEQVIGGIKYVTLNLLASALFLAAVGLVYGLAGTLNMADLAEKLRDTSRPGTVTAVSMLLLIAFGIKSAIFPLFFWLPASYHTPPAAVSAIFAGLLTKVGVYALIRAFTLLFVQDVKLTHTLILVLSGFTMLTGVLGAASQNEFRRILSFHIVSQIGYMTMGLGLSGVARSPALAVAALGGSLFYIVHHIAVKTNLFLVSGVAGQLNGTYELKSMGGLYRWHPGLACLFLVPALSLAGVPPFSGFFAKLALLQAGLKIEQYTIVGVSLLVGLLTLFSMTKIWAEAFWKVPPGMEADDPVARDQLGRGLRIWMYLPIGCLAAVTIALGLFAGPVLGLAVRAAEQLVDQQAYVSAVLGDTR